MTTLTGVLEALGLSEVEERIYSVLLDQPRSSARELSEVLDLTSGQIQRGLSLLRRKGFVTETATKPRQYVPSPPESAVEVLVLKREEELQQARLAATKMAERHRAGLERVLSGDLLEIVTGLEAQAHRFRQMYQSAREELLVIDRPPYTAGPVLNEPPDRMEVLRRVTCRTIYSSEALAIPGRLASIYEAIEAGEQARVLPDVETKLVIVDRRTGLIPLNLETTGMEDAVVVHASFLLHALTILFESLWEKATPLNSPRHAEPEADSESEELLRLLAAGLKDESIARMLGVTRRTVTRRMGEVMEELGAKTRFQAGLLAGERLKLREGPR